MSMPYRAANEVTVPKATPAELAYLAGIIDGEGTFSVATTTHTFGIQVRMTDQCVIDWLHARFGGFVSSSGSTRIGKPIYGWTLSRQADLRYVLRRLRRYLVAKQAQADAMLELIDHLQRKPSYDRPTYSVGKAERDRRRKRRARRRVKEAELRRAVQLARRP